MLGLGSSRFARRYSGSRCCFPFLGVLRCFSSPGSLHLPYLIQAGVPPHDGRWVSPFGHPRIEAWSAAPRGFSQPPTSFIGIWRQGIHRWLFIAWKSILQDARARYRILKVRIDACRSSGVETRRRDDTAGPEGSDGAIAPSKRNRGKTHALRAHCSEALDPKVTGLRTAALEEGASSAMHQLGN
jgi:hypothetical protein